MSVDSKYDKGKLFLQLLLVLIFFSMNKTVGVFWLNAAETWIDISTEDAKKVEFNLLLLVFHSSN